MHLLTKNNINQDQPLPMTMPDCAAEARSFWSCDAQMETWRLPRRRRINVVGRPVPLALEVTRGASLIEDSSASMPAGRDVRNLSWTLTLRADVSDGHTWRYSTNDLPGRLNVNTPVELLAVWLSAFNPVSGVTAVELKLYDTPPTEFKLARHSAVSCSSPADEKRRVCSISITSANCLRNHPICHCHRFPLKSRRMPVSWNRDMYQKSSACLYANEIHYHKRI